MKLPIIYYGDPILRKKAAPVDSVNDEIKQLIEDMIETMEANNGCGLAAPQINRSLAVFIASFPYYDENDKYMLGPPRVFINPKIISYSDEIWPSSEACLSIPGLRYEVERPYRITLQATDLDGNVFVEDFEEYNAHIIMHENDHLNGVLFIDRLSPKIKKGLEIPLRNIKKRMWKL